MSETKRGGMNRLVAGTGAMLLAGAAAIGGYVVGESQIAPPVAIEALASPKQTDAKFNDLASNIMDTARSNDRPQGVTVGLQNVYPSTATSEPIGRRVTLTRKVNGITYEAKADFEQAPPMTPLEDLDPSQANAVFVDKYHKDPGAAVQDDESGHFYGFAVYTTEGHDRFNMVTRSEFGPGNEDAFQSADTGITEPRGIINPLTKEALDLRIGDAHNALNVLVSK